NPNNHEYWGGRDNLGNRRLGFCKDKKDVDYGRLIYVNWSGFTLKHQSLPLLKGGISKKFQYLSALRHLDISENELTGPIPSELSELKSLRYLYLHKNKLTVSIWPWFASLKKLESIDLTGNRTDDGYFPHDEGLIELQRRLGPSKFRTDIKYEQDLERDKEIVREIWRHFGGEDDTLKNQAGESVNLWFDVIVSGDMGRTRVTELRWGKKPFHKTAPNRQTAEIPKIIGELTALVALDLSYNNLSGAVPEEILQLKQLKILRLNDNSLEANLPNLNELKELDEVSLENNKFAGGLIDLQKTRERVGEKFTSDFGTFALHDLIKAGAWVDALAALNEMKKQQQMKEIYEIRPPHDDTVIHSILKSDYHQDFGREILVKKIIEVTREKLPPLLGVNNDRGETPLHIFAAHANNTKVLKLLLSTFNNFKQIEPELKFDLADRTPLAVIKSIDEMDDSRPNRRVIVAILEAVMTGVEPDSMHIAAIMDEGLDKFKEIHGGGDSSSSIVNPDADDTKLHERTSRTVLSFYSEWGTDPDVLRWIISEFPDSLTTSFPTSGDGGLLPDEYAEQRQSDVGKTFMNIITTCRDGVSPYSLHVLCTMNASQKEIESFVESESLKHQKAAFGLPNKMTFYSEKAQISERHPLSYYCQHGTKPEVLSFLVEQYPPAIRELQEQNKTIFDFKSMSTKDTVSKAPATPKAAQKSGNFDKRITNSFRFTGSSRGLSIKKSKSLSSFITGSTSLMDEFTSSPLVYLFENITTDARFDNYDLRIRMLGAFFGGQLGETWEVFETLVEAFASGNVKVVQDRIESMVISHETEEPKWLNIFCWQQFLELTQEKHYFSLYFCLLLDATWEVVLDLNIRKEDSAKKYKKLVEKSIRVFIDNNARYRDNLLSELILEVSTADLQKIANTKIFKELLKDKMSAGLMLIYYGEFLLFNIFMVCFFSVSVEFKLAVKKEDMWEAGYLRRRVIGTAVFAGLFFLRDILQLRAAFRLGLARTWFRDYWNYVDILASTGPISLIIYFFNYGNGEDYPRLASIVACFAWLKVLSYLKSFSQPISTFTLMIFTILVDLVPFMVVLCCIGAMFGHIFYLLLSTEALDFHDDDAPHPFENYRDTFWTLYQTLLGEYDLDAFPDIYTKSFFFIYSFFVMIIFLNVLIAIVSDSYDMVLVNSVTLMYGFIYCLSYPLILVIRTMENHIRLEVGDGRNIEFEFDGPDEDEHDWSGKVLDIVRKINAKTAAECSDLKKIMRTQEMHIRKQDKLIFKIAQKLEVEELDDNMFKTGESGGVRTLVARVRAMKSHGRGLRGAVNKQMASSAVRNEERAKRKRSFFGGGGQSVFPGLSEDKYRKSEDKYRKDE
ncbi:hypothetical protein TrRE_jg11645, partial [Triparma retinervis]